MHDRMGFGADFYDIFISARFLTPGFYFYRLLIDSCVFWSMYGGYEEIYVCSATYQDIYIEYVVVTPGESTPLYTLPHILTNFALYQYIEIKLHQEY